MSNVKYPIVLEGRLTITPKSLVFLFVNDITELETKTPNVITQIQKQLNLQAVIEEWTQGTLKESQWGDDISVVYVGDDFGAVGSFIIVDYTDRKNLAHRLVFMLTNKIDPNSFEIVSLNRSARTKGLATITQNIKDVQNVSDSSDFPNLLLSLTNIRKIGIFDSVDTLYETISESTPNQRKIYLYKALRSVRTRYDLPTVRPSTVSDIVDTKSFIFLTPDQYGVSRNPATLRDKFQGDNLIFVELFQKEFQERNGWSFASQTIDKTFLEVLPYYGNAEIMRQYESDGTTVNFKDLVRNKVFEKILKDVQVTEFNKKYVLVRFYGSHEEGKKYKNEDFTSVLSKQKSRSKKKIGLLINKTKTLQKEANRFSDPTYFLNLSILEKKYIPLTSIADEIVIPNLRFARQSIGGQFPPKEMKVEAYSFNIDTLIAQIKSFLTTTKVGKGEENTFVLNLQSFNLTKDESSKILEKLLPFVNKNPNLKFIFVGLKEITKMQDFNYEPLNYQEFQRQPTTLPSKTLLVPEIVGWIGYISPYSEVIEVDGKKTRLKYAKIISVGNPKDVRIFTPPYVPWENIKKGFSQDFATLFIQKCFNKDLNYEKVQKNEKSIVETEYIQFERNNVSLPTIREGQRYFNNKYFKNIRDPFIDLGDKVRIENGYGEVKSTQGDILTVLVNVKENGKWVEKTFDVNRSNAKKSNFQRVGIFALYNNGSIQKISPNPQSRGAATIQKKYSSSVRTDFNPFDPFHYDVMKEVLDFRSEIDALKYIKKVYPSSLREVNKTLNRWVKKKNYSKFPEFVKKEFAARKVYFDITGQSELADIMEKPPTKFPYAKINTVLKNQGIDEKSIMDGSASPSKKGSNIGKTFSQIQKKKKFGGRMPWQESEFRKKKMFDYIRKELYPNEEIKYIRDIGEYGEWVMKVFYVSKLGNPLNIDLMMSPNTASTLYTDFPKWKQKFNKKYFINGGLVFLPISKINKSMTNNFGRLYTKLWRTNTEKIKGDWVQRTIKKFYPNQLTITVEDHGQEMKQRYQSAADKKLKNIALGYFGMFSPSKAANIFPRFMNYLEQDNISSSKKVFALQNPITEITFLEIERDSDGDFKAPQIRMKKMKNKLEAFDLISKFVNSMSLFDTRNRPSTSNMKVTSVIPTKMYEEKEYLVEKKVFNANVKKFIKYCKEKGIDEIPLNISQEGVSIITQEIPIKDYVIFFTLYALIMVEPVSTPEEIDSVIQVGMQYFNESSFQLEVGEEQELKLLPSSIRNLNFPIQLESIDKDPFSFLYLINQYVLPNFKKDFEEAVEIELEKQKK